MVALLAAAKGIRMGGLGGQTPLELDIFQKLCYLRKDINRFRIHLAS